MREEEGKGKEGKRKQNQRTNERSEKGGEKEREVIILISVKYSVQ